VLEAARKLEGLAELARLLVGGERLVARGVVGSSASFAAAGVGSLASRPVVLVHAHHEDAQHAADELAHLGVRVVELPAVEALPGEAARALDALSRRLAAIRRTRALTDAGDPFVVVGCVHAFMQTVPAADALDALSTSVRVGQSQDPEALLAWLASAGYERTEAVEEPGQVARRGGIIDVFPPVAADASGDEPAPVRLDFFGDEVDRISEIDPRTLAASRTLEQVELIAADLPSPGAPDAQAGDGAGGVCFLEYCPGSALALLVETLEVSEQARGYYERVRGDAGVLEPRAVVRLLRERFAGFAELNQYSAGRSDTGELALPVRRPPDFSSGGAGEAVANAARWAQGEGLRAIVACPTAGELSRLGELAADAGAGDALEPWHARVAHGFVWAAAGDRPLAVFPMHELLGRAPSRRRAGPVRATRTVDAFLSFAPGDHVVHADHGIARFQGLRLMAAGVGKPASGRPAKRSRRRGDDPALEEFLTLEFAGGSSLHVPATQIDLVQKYVGGFSGAPPLSKLGGERWKSQKQRVADSVRDLAGELLRVRAAREASEGIAFPADTPWQQEFEAEFPHEETEDQLAALVAIKRDMASPRPMDRLVCGDVGFGKTELAVRAAFKAAEYGKQVAVLVPTTVLAEQHRRTFGDRLSAYPFRVESLSRYRTAAEANAILRALRRGEVDVIIGTHRLLSKDVRFADLGLVVVDEEQRFGVEHKDALLRLRTIADVLTLSATPIPRTLHMAMLGLRDISSLTTPPVDRHAVVTEVVPPDPGRLEQAIARELSREGQVFFVHNRVHDIEARAAEVRALAPDAEVVVGHGQMPARQLEDVMLRFMTGRADVLVCTTIIESGVDLPNANTMIIDRADRFGLAELHQLRGRVGRSSRRGYCYLLLPDDGVVTAVARKRLAAVERYAMLGAGFQIAMRDLEIRGAGNLLGAEQSGHIAAVGYDMYCRLLEHAVGELSGTRQRTHSRIALDIGLRGYIPEAYIPSDQRRMDAYRRLALASSVEDTQRLRQELTQAYGDPPAPVRRLLTLCELRVALAAVGVGAAAVRGPDVVLFAADPTPAAGRLEGIAGTLAVLEPRGGGGLRRDADTSKPMHEIYWRPPEAYREPRTLADVLRARLLEQPVHAAAQ